MHLRTQIRFMTNKFGKKLTLGCRPINIYLIAHFGVCLLFSQRLIANEKAFPMPPFLAKAEFVYVEKLDRNDVFTFISNRHVGFGESQKSKIEKFMSESPEKWDNQFRIYRKNKSEEFAFLKVFDYSDDYQKWNALLVDFETKTTSLHRGGQSTHYTEKPLQEERKN